MPWSGSVASSSSEPPLAQVGDADVEADVDHRLAAVDLLVVVLERLGERRAGRLHAEVDEAGGAAERGGDGAGGEVVAGGGAAEEHLQVRVRVDGAREDVLPCGVDDLVRRNVQRLAEQRHGAVLHEHVADVVVRGGHDPPALDQHGHPRFPFQPIACCIRLRLGGVKPSPGRESGLRKCATSGNSSSRANFSGHISSGGGAISGRRLSG